MNHYHVKLEVCLESLHRKFKTFQTPTVIQRLQSMSEKAFDNLICQTAFRHGCDPDDLTMHLTTYGYKLKT